MPQKGLELDLLAESQCLSEAEVRRRKRWRRSSPLYRSYVRGNPIEPIQTDLNLGRTDTQLRSLPQHPNNLTPNSTPSTSEVIDAGPDRYFPFAYHLGPRKLTVLSIISEQSSYKKAA